MVIKRSLEAHPNRRGRTSCGPIDLLTAASVLVSTAALAQQAPPQPDPAPGEIVVTASRLDLLGKAETASQGSVTRDEVALRPSFRPGQLLETVPGLVVTIHSGEGKATQYLLRGFNLDHGTDFASFVDGMPVNRPTNTHGQGYSDQNFLMPELVAGLDYTKGPYYANIGDFGAVGSAHLRLIDQMPTTLSVSVGTLDDQRLFGGTTLHLGGDQRLLTAVELTHFDGPWQPGSNFRKVNLAARYSTGTDDDSASLTALYNKSRGLLETDQPLRAIQQDLIGRYGTLDPSDASRSERVSVSGTVAKPVGDDALMRANAYYTHSTMSLYNNFTHFLDDPVNGDQELQFERRDTAGGTLSYARADRFGDMESATTLGLQARYDDALVTRRHTVDRRTLPYCNLETDTGTISFAAVNGNCNADRVGLLDLGPYAENTTHWTPWLRTTIGFREEYYHATDHTLISGFRGTARQWLAQPKGSIAVGPFAKTELYFSAGRGFHSDDVRGVFGTVPAQGVPGGAGITPLLARASGYEVGLRSDIVPHLSIQAAMYQLDLQSETAYNADDGQDEASAPSRRRGVEVSAQYRPVRWLELNTDLAFARARYRGDLTAFDLDGRFIANAPRHTLSVGALVKDLGPWFGGVQMRNLGSYPLTDGPSDPRAKGYTEVNADVGYRLDQRTTFEVSVFNLFGSHQYAAEYYYAARLAGEPAEGVNDYQVHPLEPRSARFAVTRTF